MPYEVDCNKYCSCMVVGLMFVNNPLDGEVNRI